MHTCSTRDAWHHRFLSVHDSNRVPGREFPVVRRISMHHLVAFAALWVMPTHTRTEALAMILRWLHFIAGITWVGLLYFFNLVNVPFMKQADAGIETQGL